MTATAARNVAQQATPRRGPASASLPALRIAFGVVVAIDAALKWLPGFRTAFVGDVRMAATGQPHWLHWWFHLCAVICGWAPNLLVDITAVVETLLAIVLLFGVARRAGYIVGALWMLSVWCIPEGFRGPYTSGATDIGTGIIYTFVFLILLAVSPSAAEERWALDARLNRRIKWWPRVCEPHARDRALVTPAGSASRR